MRRRRWSLNRVAWMVLMATIWMASGVGVYLYLSSHRTSLVIKAKEPSQTDLRNTALSRLPGSLYLVQAGTLYRLQRGIFTAVLNAPGGAAGWTQPALTPDGRSLVVVRRDYAFSDLYMVDPMGNVQSQLTHNASGTIELNHWAFYPRPSPDGGSIFFSYDPKDRFNNYNVVMAVYSMPVAGGFSQAKKWTSPERLTGGDIQPVPLQSGAVLYTKYAFDTKSSRILGQIYLTGAAGSSGEPLTPSEDDCSQAALSPDGQRLAMICSEGTQFANIEIATFDGGKLGPRQKLVAGQLAAQPTWAPDGKSLVYFAPAGISGHFQLWQEQVPPLPTPSTAAPAPPPTRPASPPGGDAAGKPAPAPKPTPVPLPQAVQLTSDLDFDATSTIAWHA